MNILRYAAFTDGPSGGNPAGVLLADALPSPEEMQCTAAEIGYSETVFAARQGDSAWRTRYFAPDMEVPFCGHATLALGAALAETVAPGQYALRLNEGEITVEARVANGLVRAALQSPETGSRPAEETCVREARELFALNASDMDTRIPPAIACAGATHLILGLASRNALSRAIPYDLERGRALMEKWGLGTICLVTATAERAFAVRNAFALGGVSEDPATGAAAAALAGYLRDLGWPHGNHIEFAQGDDMGVPSRISAEFSSEPQSSIRISGTVRRL
ncbi:PhzF family phenazine biosynthesis protein [Pseudooceanicola nanhaiensis]|uniref:PhzF family phenazine biosynthesis protein n=1 Tax=Pseudooceanicola nanhaiensis TaxID=375761 RepID=UPI0040594E32